MTSTVLITGANGSLAIHTVQHLLSNQADKFLLLTVRDLSDQDLNTQKLRSVLSAVPGAKYSIRQLDLSSLAAVEQFSSSIVDEVSKGMLPKLESIICNAYYWNLTRDLETTTDGYEKTFQVTFLAHVALVLRLLGSFGPSVGRIVLFSSDAHWPGKNSLEKYPPAIPDENIDSLVKPGPDTPADNMGKGFQRYATSKLAVVTWMYALNRSLEKDPQLKNITAVAINPGNLSDSRALRVNTPKGLQFMSKYIVQPLRPLLRFVDATMRTSKEAGIDVAKLATGQVFPGERGYFTLLKKDTSSPDSLQEATQQRLWEKSLDWARITADNTSLRL
ncbi:NAD(P)-binding protein [Melanomma pulvis-pyrius CBS 109.77]|uniref:3beta-hydroxysteroid 3-dehydrogenase n=1 Tax=Melanomma pulvis-pyrius CBS 109.77 TaxID=1314802 RepID=A0A6A6WX38_9PLEO|nr:NAD(P)-binding protein [Melanomma pulvis-pyrius CBS 109.77]